MTITEQNRHQLYQRLEEVLGHEEAAVLMEHLPPVGWADVATRRDIDQLADATKRDIDHAMDKLRADLYRSLNQQTYVLITAMFALAGAVIGAAKVL